MGRNFDDYPGFQPFRSWANTYAQDCIYRGYILYKLLNYMKQNLNVTLKKSFYGAIQPKNKAT